MFSIQTFETAVQLLPTLAIAETARCTLLLQMLSVPFVLLVIGQIQGLAESLRNQDRE
jgi:hypothetical protein